MNSKKSNEKIVQILSEMEPIHDETEEERIQREQMIIEAKKNAEEEEGGLAFARKAAGIFCGVLWVFCIVAFMVGMGEIGVLLPFMLLALGVVCALNIPVFVKKGKTGDVIMAILTCGVCLLFAVAVLFKQ
ncbi:MAG: hypothetical protein NC203_03085 [Firmicutes bacterium]|nr:hypothetical protein [[Eubacterium] siraeum]MCM1487329.1 hypothetical protein [Bacillota bacterium]